MANKEKVEMKRFRVVLTLEYDAPDRETAVARAKEQFGVTSPHAKVRVQEGVLSWMTIPDAPTS
jgi:hypothetical protein